MGLPAWLALREDADAAARAADLVDRLPPVATVLDLGCGAGSMSRWLAPRLPAPGHWILADRDPALLGLAVAGLPAGATGEARELDVTALTPDDLAGVDLVTASALLDLLTAAEVDHLAATCRAARCPALLTLSVSGEVRLDPAEPRDAVIAAAFDAHQRRTVRGRRLLGPDAGAAAAAAFARHGATVHTRSTPWRLDATRQGLLLRAWLDGWVDAAVDQEPDLAPRAAAYRVRRGEAVDAGALRVDVGHRDVLALVELP